MNGVLTIVCAAVLAASPAAPPSAQPSPLEDVIPLTMGNLRGHAMLYDEGWFIVTSSRKAFAYAREKSIDSSGAALARAKKAIAKDTAAYGKTVKEDVTDAAAAGKEIVAFGTRQTGDILETTHKAAKAEWAYSKESFEKAVDAFVQGNISLAKRTEEERRELASIPGDYFRNLKSDFSNLYDLTVAARQRFSGRIDANWDKAFARASDAFRKEYERSGESQNSLTALGPVLAGWLKAFYHGVAAPTSKTIVKTGTAGAAYGVFLPVAATTVVAGRTVQSVGLTVYTTGKTGVKIISPTVEGGLLAGMSMLSAGAVPATYAAGGTIGAVNQVAFTAAGPAYTAAAGTATTALNTAAYVAYVGYDAGAGAVEVVINQAASGIVLGYNALTALPTHVVLGVSDAAVFLAWDGPRLVIAAATGKIKSGDDEASLGDLPVGSVVDLKKLESAGGVKVEILTTDEKIIKDVLNQMPNDLREKTDEPRTAK